MIHSDMEAMNSNTLYDSAQIHQILSMIKKQLQSTVNSMHQRPLIVAVDGMCGSGKTTLGNLLHNEFPESNLFHMDDYFLQPYQRTPERLSEIGGNVDYERFQTEILEHIANPNGLNYRIYNCKTQSLGPEIKCDWKPLIIIEGAYSHHPYFATSYSLRIFCEITEAEQRKRILKRNGELMLHRFINEWIPKENIYFRTFQIKEKADILL